MTTTTLLLFCGALMAAGLCSSFTADVFRSKDRLRSAWFASIALLCLVVIVWLFGEVAP
jgi:hypothetical protein